MCSTAKRIERNRYFNYVMYGFSERTIQQLLENPKATFYNYIEKDGTTKYLDVCMTYYKKIVNTDDRLLSTLYSVYKMQDVPFDSSLIVSFRDEYRNIIPVDAYNAERYMLNVMKDYTFKVEREYLLSALGGYNAILYLR